MKEKEFHNWMSEYTELAESSKDHYINYLNRVEGTLGNIDAINLSDFDIFLEKIKTSFPDLAKKTTEDFHSAAVNYKHFKEWETSKINS